MQGLIAGVVDLRISDVETILVDLPVKRPHRHAAVEARNQSFLMIRIRTDGGIVGTGEVVTPGGPWWSGDSVEAVKATIDCYLAPAIIGEDSSRIVHLMRKLDRVAAGNWFAKAGLEMAFYDIAGKSIGRPTYALLGGACRDHVPVTWPLGAGEAARDIDEAQQRIDTQVARSFKIKMGSLPVETDVKRTLEIARALSGKAQLRVDLNAAWSESTAQRNIPAIIEAGIVLVEQPIERWNLRGHERLARRFNVPLMADESLETKQDAVEIASHDAARVFALKLMKSGGIDATRQIAAIASAHGIGLFGGCFLEASIGTAANLQLGAVLPELAWGSEWIGPLWLADDLTATPVQYSDYGVSVPSGPGLGVELDPEKLAFYRRDKERIVSANAAFGS